ISPPVNTIRTEEPPLATPQDPPSISSFQKPMASSPSIVVSPPMAVATPPTVGYVAPVTPPAPKGNVWGAATSPNPLPSQPAAVPLGPRPLPSGPTRAKCRRGSRKDSLDNQAERTGFEPVEQCYPLTGLANRRFRPLSHLSRSESVRLSSLTVFLGIIRLVSLPTAVVKFPC